KYRMTPRQSHPSASEFTIRPRPHSPASNAFFHACIGLGWPYGTTISLGAVQDRPDTAAVLVADGVQDETVHRVHRHAEAPPLPPHLVALHREARPLG